MKLKVHSQFLDHRESMTIRATKYHAYSTVDIVLAIYSFYMKTVAW